MNREIQSIIQNLENTLDGEPWYGRAVYPLLREVEPTVCYKKPTPASHSLIELLYHMLTWAEFTLKRIEKEIANDPDAMEKLDWREIDPQLHNWDEGLGAFIAANQEIVTRLHAKDDSFLDETVDYRKYNFRYLLNGIVQHNVYHAGQVAYVKKLLA
jgi:uncharacterized damage-inducible protein DinB